MNAETLAKNFLEEGMLSGSIFSAELRAGGENEWVLLLSLPLLPNPCWTESAYERYKNVVNGLVALASSLESARPIS
jgi:hypothetical protein